MKNSPAFKVVVAALATMLVSASIATESFAAPDGGGIMLIHDTGDHSGADRGGDQSAARSDRDDLGMIGSFAEHLDDRNFRDPIYHQTDCWQPRRVRTPTGWYWEEVEVC